MAPGTAAASDPVVQVQLWQQVQYTLECRSCYTPYHSIVVWCGASVQPQTRLSSIPLRACITALCSWEHAFLLFTLRGPALIVATMFELPPSSREHCSPPCDVTVFFPPVAVPSPLLVLSWCTSYRDVDPARAVRLLPPHDFQYQRPTTPYHHHHHCYHKFDDYTTTTN